MGAGVDLTVLASAVLSGESVDGPDVRLVLDAIGDPIFVKDRELRWVVLNAAAEKLFGFPREAMLGKTDADFFRPSEAAFFREKDLEVFASRKTVVIDQEPITDAKGELHYLATTKTPLLDAAGEATHVVGIIHDITDLVRAEEALKRANEELERRVAERTRALETAQADLVRKERLAVLGRLAGGVAHQIRNPLAAIANVGTILERHAKDPSHPTFGEALRILRDETAHANRIVTDLVNYARIRPPMRRAVPLERMVADVVESEELPPGVRIEVSGADATDALCDELQTHEALRNLVRNGIEAMPGGGLLRIAIDTPSTSFVRIVVEDQGDGIPQAVRERMFEPLVTTKPMGLGLGLVTAQTLVTSQGGRLEWSSEEGHGTRFEMWLPRARASVGFGALEHRSV
jgi:PAS domain S-box-containing protein